MKIHPDLDIWIVHEFDRSLGFDASNLLSSLALFPTRSGGDRIRWGECQWVDGTHRALKYRGHDLRRKKIWLQRGDPLADGFTKYYYTGWQRRVLPATSCVDKCPAVVPIWDAYDSFCDANHVMRANHSIVTSYADGKHGIGAHFDKPQSIAASTAEQSSMITVLKLGPSARRFTVELLDGTVVYDNTVAPGTAIMMTLEANLQTKHAVPEVDECGPSGSIVFRTITDAVPWEKLQAELRKMDEKEAAAGTAAPLGAPQ